MKKNQVKILITIFFVFTINFLFAQRQEGERENENQTEFKEKGVPPERTRHQLNDFMSIITPIEDVRILEAKEIKPNKMIPRWYCPYLEVDTYYSDVRLGIGNFSTKPVKVRLIIWNYDGTMESTGDFELKGKAHVVFLFDFAKDIWSSFRGSMEIQSNSPAVFPSAKYLAEETIPIPNSQGNFKIYTESFTLDWYRLDK